MLHSPLFCLKHPNFSHCTLHTLTDCSICRSSWLPGQAWGRWDDSAGGHSAGSWTGPVEAAWMWPRHPQPPDQPPPLPQGSSPPPPVPGSVCGHSLDYNTGRGLTHLMIIIFRSLLSLGRKGSCPWWTNIDWISAAQDTKLQTIKHKTMYNSLQLSLMTITTL